ncbi:MAG: ferritin family protein [Acidobacteriota bacterium]|jgi:rubrerythrin
MSSTKTEIMDVLKKAMRVEADGYTFYSMVADKSDKTSVQQIFDKLAKDELEHKSYLKEVAGNVDEKGAGAFSVNLRNPDLKLFSDALFTESFKRDAAGAAFEFSALSIGMQLEANAIDTFSRAAQTAGEKEVKSFYEFLANWERGHMDALKRLFESVRGDFWDAGGFAPF